LEEYVSDLIKGFVRDYILQPGSRTSWREPLTGFASADDPMFKQLRAIVAEEHIMPQDVVRGAKTVISYFIPFTRELAHTNSQGLSCSREWAAAYVETNRMIADLNRFLASKLEASGHETAAADWCFDRDKLISNWSQRHVAYIAGLGTFGINNMLITEEGCCGRYGSVVTSLELKPSPRTAAENCLYKKNGSCRACVRHCIYGALTEERFDRKKCYEVCLGNSELHREVGDAEACGKCLTDVPCSYCNPAGKGGRP
jgi:epoxyqueuosine reductase QueG